MAKQSLSVESILSLNAIAKNVAKIPCYKYERNTTFTDDTFTVTLSDGRKFQLYHEQDCCESVYLEDVTGHTDDLLNVPIINAIVTVADDEFTEYGDVCQWTFYHLFTAKGGVTLRWLGSSNGYYSISVDFREIV